MPDMVLNSLDIDMNKGEPYFYGVAILITHVLVSERKAFETWQRDIWDMEVGKFELLAQDGSW